MSIFEIENDKKEPLSLLKLGTYLVELLNWKFISFPEKNVAIDGLIEIFNSNKQKSGEHIWVEVKTGNSYFKYGIEDTFITIDLKKKNKIERWRSIWSKVPGAIILVFVYYQDNDTNKPIFYWVDLKRTESYIEGKPTQIKIPSNQVINKDFPIHCRSLVDYKGKTIYSGNLPTLSMGIGCLDYIKLNKPLKYVARKQYLKWSRKSVEARTNPKFGEIIVNRVGWQHMSRKTRRLQRINQSWQLLTVAEEMIRKVVYSRQIENKPKWRFDPIEKTVTFKDYYYLKAKIKFSYRSETIVYVILRKITKLNCLNLEILDKKVWFYSIYEADRGVKKMDNPTSNK